MVCPISTHFNTKLKLLGGLKKGLEAQTMAQIQDDITNNFTIHENLHENLLKLFGMHSDTGRLELQRRRRRRRGRKEGSIT
jgi:hypothetical protein